MIERRALLRAAAALPFASLPWDLAWGQDAASGPGAVPPQEQPSPEARLVALEKDLGGSIGLAALDTGSAKQFSHRAQERFAFCSTFKVMAASAILKRSEANPGLLQRHIAFGPADVVAYSPVTSLHAGQGMAVAEICAAALQYSDNTAANLMIRLLGGPGGVTAFAREIGDRSFRLDRMETALNTAIPGDPRDTTTPAAMLRSLRALTLGRAFGSPQRRQLVDWMRGCTTGAKRIRAGLPDGWSAAEKTGSGDYGAANDIGVIFPPGRAPILLLIYTVRRDKLAGAREDVIAEATRIALSALG